jgi:hypothetical protein
MADTYNTVSGLVLICLVAIAQSAIHSDVVISGTTVGPNFKRAEGTGRHTQSSKVRQAHSVEWGSSSMLVFEGPFCLWPVSNAEDPGTDFSIKDLVPL